MKNIQAQYQDLLEGRMTKANFMRNVRMGFPQYVSPTTSFDDSVSILKGKRILSEGDYGWDDPRDKETYEHEQLHDAVNQKYEEVFGKEMPVEDFKKIEAFINSPAFRKAKNEFFDNPQGLLSHILDKALKPKDSLNEAKKPIGVYGHNPNAENDLYRGIDHVNYYQMYRGLQYELAKAPEITDEAYVKARKKVVDAILKNPDAYKDLQLANFKAVKDMDKDLEMKDVKADNKVDKANEMKVVKKDAPASANEVKKDKKKKEKIAQMTQTPKGGLKAFETPGKEKVIALKEHILDELMTTNMHKEDINKGSRVKKKDLKAYDASKVGNVTEFDGDTATVKWDNGQVEHVQANVLTKKEIPALPDAAERWGKIPDSPFAKRQEVEDVMQESEEEKQGRLKELKDKLIKSLRELGFITQTDTGITVDSGTNMNKGVDTAKGLEQSTKKQLTVTDLETGAKKQV